jgi:hypothetical protein
LVRVALLVLAVAGCEGVEYRAAELQLDVLERVPDSAETVRICVDGVGEQVFGARFNGRFAVTGLPTGRTYDVAIDALDADGELVGAWSGVVSGYGVGDARCSDDTGMACEPCDAQGGFVQPGEDSWLLAVHFSG